jgi:hypothetical protein
MQAFDGANHPHVGAALCVRTGGAARGRAQRHALDLDAGAAGGAQGERGFRMGQIGPGGGKAGEWHIELVPSEVLGGRRCN